MELTDANLLTFRIELETLITRREGMIAENMWRQHRGESLAYTEDGFAELESRMIGLKERVKIQEGRQPK